MDNIQLILYIVFVVGYLLFKALTGKNKPVTRQDPKKFDQDEGTDHREYDPTGAPKSFEEILEELAGGRRKEVQKPEKVEVAPEVKTSGEKNGYEENQLYEKSIKEARKYATLDERIDLENLDINVGEVEDIAEDDATTARQNPYLAMFNNLEDAKKAIVMSEILNRKH